MNNYILLPAITVVIGVLLLPSTLTRYSPERSEPLDEINLRYRRMSCVSNNGPCPKEKDSICCNVCIKSTKTCGDAVTEVKKPKEETKKKISSKEAKKMSRKASKKKSKVENLQQQGNITTTIVVSTTTITPTTTAKTETS